MNPETKMVVLLLFLPPMIGELLSGSSPPLSFFSGGIIFLVLLYGCGTLLIREAKARWKLQWSVIFLAVAYGIIEEGTMVQSFFNVDHVDLGVLSGYDMYLGVQWPWSIALTVYHATISTLVPLVIVEYLYPGYKNIPLLKKRGTALCLAGFIFVILFWLMVGIFFRDIPMYATYHFSYALNSVTLLVVAILIWLAYQFKTSRISSKTRVLSPFTFGFIGFWIMIINLFIPNILAEMQTPGGITILIQLIWVALLLLFLFYQVYNGNTTKRHIVSLVFGFLLFFIVLTPLQEVGMAENPDPTAGMLAVGIVAFGLLILWRRTVLRGENSPPKNMRVPP
jgi:hypothetical protein